MLQDQYQAGPGTYARQGHIYASIVGHQQTGNKELNGQVCHLTLATHIVLYVSAKPVAITSCWQPSEAGLGRGGSGSSIVP